MIRGSLFSRLLRAEALKVTSLTHLWLLAGMLLISQPVLAVPLVYFQLVPEPGGFAMMAPGADLTFSVLGGLQASYLLIPAFVVLSISADVASGFSLLQASAIPQRGWHVAAKLAVLVGATVGCGVVGAGLAIAAGRITLVLGGVEPPRFSWSTAFITLGWVALAMALLTMLAAGIGWAVRQAGLALAAAVGLLMVIPMLLSLMPRLNRWSAVLPTVSSERFTLPGYSSLVLGWHDPATGGAVAIVSLWVLVVLPLGWLRYCRADLPHR